MLLIQASTPDFRAWIHNYTLGWVELAMDKRKIREKSSHQDKQLMLSIKRFRLMMLMLMHTYVYDPRVSKGDDYD